MNEALANAMAEANRAFDQMRAVVEEEVGRAATQLDVAEIARRSGLEIEAATLDDLRVDRVIACSPGTSGSRGGRCGAGGGAAIPGTVAARGGGTAATGTRGKSQGGGR
jgi:hypothetical protein